MRIFLRRVWADIKQGESIDVYAIVLVGVILTVLNLIGIVPDELIAPVTLGVLALLAFAFLGNRHRLEKIGSDIQQIAKHRTSLGDILGPRNVLPPLRKRLAAARSLDISGMSLLAIATSHHELLIEKARTGCRIRLMLLNPQNEGLMEMTASFVGSLVAETHRHEIHASLNTLTSDPALFESSLVEIRLSDYPLSHSHFIINGDAPQGEMRIELYMHRRRPSGTPGFIIQKAHDPTWFDLFWQEFNTLWKTATPYSLGGAPVPRF